jgi:hypothetical protein
MNSYSELTDCVQEHIAMHFKIQPQSSKVSSTAFLSEEETKIG